MLPEKIRIVEINFFQLQPIFQYDNGSEENFNIMHRVDRTIHCIINVDKELVAWVCNFHYRLSFRCSPFKLINTMFAIIIDINVTIGHDKETIWSD